MAPSPSIVSNAMPRQNSLHRVLKEDLLQARKGLQYYQARVTMLEKALDELSSATASNEKGKGKLSRSKASTAARRLQSSTVPPTGLDFWLRHITKKQRSAVEIAQSAATALKIDPVENRDAYLVLKNRIGPALQALVKAERVQSHGAGRDRRFFK